MRGYPREEARARAREAAQEFGIHYHDRMVSTLSGGMVRKMLLAMVLSADVPVYCLDEPTVGLDVENRAEALGHAKEEGQSGLHHTGGKSLPGRDIQYQRQGTL